MSDATGDGAHAGDADPAGDGARQVPPQRARHAARRARRHRTSAVCVFQKGITHIFLLFIILFFICNIF